jgi:hypothetical protein
LGSGEPLSEWQMVFALAKLFALLALFALFGYWGI